MKALLKRHLKTQSDALRAVAADQVRRLGEDARQHVAQFFADVRSGKWRVRIVIERRDAALPADPHGCE